MNHATLSGLDYESSGHIGFASSEDLVSLSGSLQSKPCGTNTSYGEDAGIAISTGVSNVCVGYTSGRTLTTGHYNIFIGPAAGYGDGGIIGSGNIGIGGATLESLQVGSANICIGLESGEDIWNGSNNVCIGSRSGYNLLNGYGNVCIGTEAGYSLVNEDYKFHLGTEGKADLMIGDFDNRTLTIAAALTLQNGNSVNEFSIDGTFSGNSDNAVPTEKASKTYMDNLITDLTPFDILTNTSGTLQDQIDSSYDMLVTASGILQDQIDDLDFVSYEDLITTSGVLQDQIDNFSNSKIESGYSSVEVSDTDYISHTINDYELMRLTPSTLRMFDSVDAGWNMNNGLNSAKDNNWHGVQFRVFADTYNKEALNLYVRGRGTNASPSSVQSGDLLGAYAWYGYYNTGVNDIDAAAYILVECEGVSGNQVKGKIRFLTNNGSGESDRLVIRSDGTIEPGIDNLQDIGSSSYRWDDIYATNATIQTSDERMKTDITDSKLGLDFVRELNPVSYKWVNYKAQHNTFDAGYDEDGAYYETTTTGTIEHVFNRNHYGLIAQDVEAALTKLGIDTSDFAGYVYDEKSDSYGLRYNEFIAPMIKAIQEQQGIIEKLESRLEALESKISKM
jgi:hypothetical protein